MKKQKTKPVSKKPVPKRLLGITAKTKTASRQKPAKNRVVKKIPREVGAGQVVPLPGSRSALAVLDAEEPSLEFRDKLERTIERFCRTKGWTDVMVDFEDFKAGTIQQLSFHQRGSLPGQIRSEAERFATDMQTYLHLFRYDATGGVVLEIARIAEEEGRAMQALLDAAVRGYVKRS